MKNKITLNGEEFEEITLEEYLKLPFGEGAYCNSRKFSDMLYFKKVEVFPIILQDDYYQFEINKKDLIIREKSTANSICFLKEVSFPILLKAIEKAKEVSK